jgi:hypothetical protein
MLDSWPAPLFSAALHSRRIRGLSPAGFGLSTALGSPLVHCGHGTAGTGAIVRGCSLSRLPAARERIRAGVRRPAGAGRSVLATSARGSGGDRGGAELVLDRSRCRPRFADSVCKIHSGALAGLGTHFCDFSVTIDSTYPTSPLGFGGGSWRCLRTCEVSSSALPRPCSASVVVHRNPLPRPAPPARPSGRRARGHGPRRLS